MSAAQCVLRDGVVGLQGLLCLLSLADLKCVEMIGAGGVPLLVGVADRASMQSDSHPRMTGHPRVQHGVSVREGGEVAV